MPTYPASAHAGRAREMIAAIELAEIRRREAVAWAGAQRSGDKAGLERFARTRPHSIYAPEARRRVAVLEVEDKRRDDADWDKAVRLTAGPPTPATSTAHPKGSPCRRCAPPHRRPGDARAAPGRARQDAAGERAGTVAAAPPGGRPRAPEPNQGWPSADEPFIGADGRIRR